MANQLPFTIVLDCVYTHLILFIYLFINRNTLKLVSMWLIKKCHNS